MMKLLGRSQFIIENLEIRYDFDGHSGDNFFEHTNFYSLGRRLSRDLRILNEYV